MRPGSGWRMRVLAVTAVTALAACGANATALTTADTLRDLITIDQLVAPGFVVTTPAAHVDATTLGDGDAGFASALAHDGLQSAARVEYQRAVDFGSSNGPIDVVATVERFSGVGGASSAYTADVRRLDAIHGAVPTSTGPLGDEAHSTSVVRTAPDGLQAVEITVLWRVGNLVNVIIARGRYGGTRLDEALTLAGLQTHDEQPSG